MSRKVRENIIVTKGDHAFVPAGTQLLIPQGGTQPPKLNLVPGQGFIADPKTFITVDPATFDPNNNPQFMIGVGVDMDGDGIAETIRTSFGEHIDVRNLTAYNVAAPQCPIYEIVDFKFKCTYEDMPYGLSVFVDDDMTQNQYPFNKPSVYTYTTKVKGSACSDCTTEDICSDVAQRFVDAINQDAFRDMDIRLNEVVLPLEKVFLPFEAAYLFPQSYTFCLNPSSNPCGGCTAVPAITGVRFDVDGTPTDFNFTFTTNPSDSTQTMIGQLENVVMQINDVLPVGRASLLGNPAECCSLTIDVNTPVENMVFLDASGDPVNPCSVTNPFDGTDFECGFRLYAKPVEIKCSDPFPPNPVLGYFGRHIKVFPSDGFQDAGVQVTRIQDNVFPKNLGYNWKHREYRSDNGGLGRDFNPYNDKFGPIGLPGTQDRAMNTITDCKETYCSYIFEHKINDNGNGVFGRIGQYAGRTILLIPAGDTATQTSFEAYMANFADASHITAKSCAGE